MLVRLKRTGETIDVYKEGTVISNKGIIPVYYEFGDEYKVPIYGDEIVIE